MAWLCFSLCRYTLSCKHTRDTHIITSVRFNLLKNICNTFFCLVYTPFRIKHLVLDVGTAASYTNVFKVTFCLCVTPVCGLVLWIGRKLARFTATCSWEMIKSLLTSRLCRKTSILRFFFLDATEKWTATNETIFTKCTWNHTSERYIKKAFV